MSIHPPIPRTAAESALLAAYDSRIADLPGDAGVSNARDTAIEAFKANGLPTRRVESWHYTDLKSLLRAMPEGGETGGTLAPLIDGSAILEIVDGAARPVPEMPGIIATRIEAKLTDGSFARALGIRGPDDTIGMLNAAFVSDGYHLAIAGDVTKPVEIQVRAGTASHSRLAVRVDAGANATIIERQCGGDGFVSAVSHLTVGDDARVVWVIDQERGAKALQLGQFNAVLGRNSGLTLFIMNAGGALVRQEVHVAAEGEGASFTLRGVNLIGGDSHVDNTMTLAHLAENTASSAVFRNVVTARGHGVFQGQIRVAREAQKTDAKMACNTLLLSDDAEFSAKPELEIFADDVACGHGATVTEIDAAHLFYLKARGIAEPEARGLLIKAFLAAIIEELEDEALVEALETRLADWLETNR